MLPPPLPLKVISRPKETEAALPRSVVGLSEDRGPLDLPSCDDRRMWDVMMSVYHFPTLTAADELGLFPYLADSSATEGEVSKKFSLSSRAAEALLGVLTSLGFLARVRHSNPLFHDSWIMKPSRKEGIRRSEEPLAT